MWVPVPPSAQAALAGATVLANLSASPVTVGRCGGPATARPVGQHRCNAAYIYTAAGPGESTTDLSWDGQTMVYECGDLLGESERFPDGPRATVVDVDLDRMRQERIRQGSHDDNRRGLGIGDFDSAGSSSSSRRRPATSACCRKVDRYPFVPDDAARLALDCYEAYNIQVSGLEQRLRAIGQPKVVIGVSGGLDSTHALIVAAKAMDRLGRPRSDIQAFTMPGFATGETTKSYATRLATALGITFEELDIRPAAGQMLGDLKHPYADGRGGLRRHVRERPGRPAHRLPVPARQPPRRHRARHRRPVRAGARLVHVRRRRPDVALQRQRRRPEDPDPAPDPLGDRQQPVSATTPTRRRAPRDPRAGDHPRADPDRRRRASRRRPRTPSAPTPSRTSRSSTSPPRLPAEQDRLPRLARLAGRRGGGVAAGLPRGRADVVRPGRRSGSGSRSSSSGSSRASSSARRCPTAPRSATAAPCRRAATGGCRRTPAPRPGWPRSRPTFPGSRSAPRLAPWASRKTSFSALSRSVTSGSSGCGSPTCSGS